MRSALLLEEIAPLEHPRHLDDTLQLDLTPSSAHRWGAQRARKVGRLGTQFLLRRDQRRDLLTQSAIGLAARTFDLAKLTVQFAEGFTDGGNHRTEFLIGDGEKTLVGRVKSVRGKRFESVAQLALRGFEEALLLGEVALALLHPHHSLAELAFPQARRNQPCNERPESGR